MCGDPEHITGTQERVPERGQIQDEPNNVGERLSGLSGQHQTSLVRWIFVAVSECDLGCNKQQGNGTMHASTHLHVTP